MEKVWFGLGQEFARLGHEVVHISRQCDDLPKQEHIAGVLHRRVSGFDTPASLLKLKWYDLLYTRRAAKVVPRSDVVVTNTFWSPLILSPRNHGPIWVHVQRYPKRQMALYRRAAQLQTVSSVIARAIIAQAPGMADRVSVIPNPLPPVAPLAAEVRRNASMLLFVGRLHPEKGVELLLRAFVELRKLVPSARLRLVGPSEARFGGGGDDFLAHLKNLAAMAGDAVEFVGPVFDESALSAHFSSAAVFVYPSLAGRGEASPVAPLEALARGLPVVVSDLECFADYLPAEAPYAHRFAHESPDACSHLVAALAPLLNRPNHEHAAAAAARAQEFSLPKIAARYLDGFSSLAHP